MIVDIKKYWVTIVLGEITFFSKIFSPTITKIASNKNK